MNTDIRLKTTFPQHIKTRKLIKKLGYKGFYSLITLWCYAAVNKPRGILDNMSVEDIAIAADWDEDPEIFVDSLIRCSFIEKTDGGVLALHDWGVHNAYAAHAQERSSTARVNALLRWGKRPLGSLLRHEDPEVRKEAAKLLAQQRHTAPEDTTQVQRMHNADPTHDIKTGNAGLNARSNAGGNATPQSLDSQGFDASPMQTLCKPYAPSPSPSPSPIPEEDCKEMCSDKKSDASNCTQSDKSDFVPSNSKNKVLFNEKTLSFKGLDIYVSKWEQAYPLIDVSTEIKAMEAWVAALPKSRWKKDWRRFVTNWLSREQDKAELRMAKAGGNGRRFLDD